MSYQVLARKWRPRNFATLVGQEHVVRALTHALEQKRLHHAWLFTGTRGVGKTTLSRILAKALNCIGPDGQGDVTAQPCGVCPVCVEIDAGRFVDYIEMDAASNRGISEMAALLEQAIYAPSNARYKVYMIDEVHMLTNHAFNSMLKTLEEPPEHVKFILATTEPQKIPVTVLSRCLQFNLKQMPPAQIVGHLEHILAQEQVPFEMAALRLLAQGASGSMRDALSLTDQAIAYSAGHITEETVRSMLGSLDQTYLVRILDALAAEDGAALLSVADEIAARSLSYGAALQDLGVLLHHIALAQTVPDAVGDDWPEAEQVRRLAGLFCAEEIQLHYQIAAHGRSELTLAPDEYAGFSMTLLRMLAFRPSRTTGSEPVSTPTPEQASAARPPQRTAPAARALEAARQGPALGPASLVRPPEAPRAISAVPAATPRVPVAPTPPSGTINFDGNWIALAASLRVSGITRQLVEQAELASFDGAGLKLRVPIRALIEGGSVDKLKKALAEHFGRPVPVEVTVGAVQGTTVAAVENGERAARLASAVATIENDPFVQALVRDFGASVVPGSIKPIQTSN